MKNKLVAKIAAVALAAGVTVGAAAIPAFATAQAGSAGTSCVGCWGVPKKGN